jgi:menaquinone-dependent protoporphyrinogen oxidase
VEICKRIQDVIENDGHEVTIRHLVPDADIELSTFDRVVIGASIRYGKHKPELKQFIDAQQSALEEKSAAFFSVNAVARKPEKLTPETNPYVRKFLASINWKPTSIGIFGGKIDYPIYGFVDRTMIRFIMWMTKGPTDPTGTFEFTDWDAVERFARELTAMTPAPGGTSQ